MQELQEGLSLLDRTAQPQQVLQTLIPTEQIIVSRDRGMPEQLLLIHQTGI